MCFYLIIVTYIRILHSVKESNLDKYTMHKNAKVTSFTLDLGEELKIYETEKYTALQKSRWVIPCQINQTT